MVNKTLRHAAVMTIKCRCGFAATGCQDRRWRKRTREVGTDASYPRSARITRVNAAARSRRESYRAADRTFDKSAARHPSSQSAVFSPTHEGRCNGEFSAPEPALRASMPGCSFAIPRTFSPRASFDPMSVTRLLTSTFLREPSFGVPYADIACAAALKLRLKYNQQQ